MLQINIFHSFSKYTALSIIFDGRNYMLSLLRRWTLKKSAERDSNTSDKENVYNVSLRNIDIKNNADKLVKVYYLSLGEDGVTDYNIYIPPSVISVTGKVFLSIDEKGAVMALQDTEEEYSDLPIAFLITYPDTILKNTYFIHHISLETLQKLNIDPEYINRSLVFIDSSGLLRFGINLLYHPNDKVTTIDISSDNLFAVFLINENGMVNIDYLILDEDSGKRNILEIRTLLMYMGNLFFIPATAHETLIHYKLMLPLLKGVNIL
jgi:hypothetical protein